MYIYIQFVDWFHLNVCLTRPILLDVLNFLVTSASFVLAVSLALLAVYHSISVLRINPCQSPKCKDWKDFELVAGLHFRFKKVLGLIILTHMAIGQPHFRLLWNPPKKYPKNTSSQHKLPPKVP
jgi:hypothetical protein